jgi:quinoprotein glucose dehydrogenase
MVKADAKTIPSMSDYPVGVARPKNRYSTDYGTAWPDLLGAPWVGLWRMILTPALLNGNTSRRRP